MEERLSLGYERVFKVSPKGGETLCAEVSLLSPKERRALCAEVSLSLLSLSETRL